MRQSKVRDMSLPTISALKRSELRTMVRFTARHFPLSEDRKKVTSECRRLIRVRYGTAISSIPDKHFAEAYALIRAYCESTLGKPLPEDACLRGIPPDAKGLSKLLPLVQSSVPAPRRKPRAKKAAVNEAEKVAEASDAETSEVKTATEVVEAKA